MDFNFDVRAIWRLATLCIKGFNLPLNVCIEHISSRDNVGETTTVLRMDIKTIENAFQHRVCIDSVDDVISDRTSDRIRTLYNYISSYPIDFY